MGYLPGYATPRIVCDVPFVGKRWVHMVTEYDREHGISYWTKNYRTSIEAADREALRQALRLLRPDRHPARVGPAVVGRTPARPGVTLPRGGRGCEGIPAAAAVDWVHG